MIEFSFLLQVLIKGALNLIISFTEVNIYSSYQLHMSWSSAAFCHLSLHVFFCFVFLFSYTRQYVGYANMGNVLISECILMDLTILVMDSYIFNFLQVINQFWPNCWNSQADVGRLTFLNRLGQTTKLLVYSCFKTTVGQSFLALNEQRCTMQMRLTKPSWRSGSVEKARDPSHGILWWNAYETQNWTFLLMKLKKYYNDSCTSSLL